MKKYKYTIIAHTGISNAKVIEKICTELGIDKIPDPIEDIVGYRDKNGKLDFSFLDTEDGKGRLIITTSDNIIRQINLSILRGSLEKLGSKIPSRCESIKSIDYLDVEAFFINKKGTIKRIEATETGLSIPEFDKYINEVNDMMEAMYYMIMGIKKRPN